MRRSKLYSTVALVGLAGLLTEAAPAHAQPKDVRAIKPVMMLLVDTSGSMEYLPDTASQTNKLPVCTNSAADTAQKNRWAITLEALTGTFQTYRCVERARSYYSSQFDENYFLSHYDFSVSPTQASDGVLDAFKSRLKFGLMTFDGVLTTVDGDTLVAYDQYASSGTLRSQINGRAGMYSYPETTEDDGDHGWMRLFFPGCPTYYGVNAGARGKGTEPGSLISVGVSDAASDVQLVNQRIQESLLQVRPYGGTPIAGMLDDLRYYLNNDTDVKRNSDPYFTCRKRFAVLLTDGAPDALFRDNRFNCADPSVDRTGCEGDDCCPYDTEESITRKLVRNDGLDKLWVVAFNINDATAMQHLDRIALVGANGDSNNNTAINAQTPSQLRTALTNVMNLAQPDATSRSVPVMVDNGKLLYMSGGKQFEIVAGFKIGAQDDEPWEGTLFRRRTECDGASPVTRDISTSEKDAFHVELNTQSAANQRVVNTVHPPLDAGVSAMRGTLYGRESNNIDSTGYNLNSAEKVNTNRPDGTTMTTAVITDSTAASTQERTADDLPLATFGSSTAAGYFGDANKNGVAAEDADRVAIDQYLRGQSDNRKTRTLGDIYHSNPVVLPPLVYGSSHTETTDPALRAYYQMITNTGSTGRYDPAYGRPGVVFVGTNDGLLHAFNLDTWKSKGGVTRTAGHEFWSFVPPALFDKLAATVSPSHQIMFDGTPIVRDVVYKRVLTTTTYNTADYKLGTVLLVGIRGAPAYLALDVTYPEEPKFLWQRSFPYLGNTIAQPEIAHVRINWNNTEQFRAVAILPGGEGEIDTSATSCDVHADRKPPNGRSTLRCWRARGRSLYVVDVATGELIQEFDARHFHAPLTGSVAIDGAQLGASQAAYFTDDDGLLYRLSMVNPDPRKWRVQPIWDLFADEGVDFDGDPASTPTPTYSFGRVAPFPPVLTRDQVYGTLTILVATGDVENLTDTAAHRVVSLQEKRTYDTNSKELALASDTYKKNWTLQLERGEAVTGPMVVWQDTVYLSTFRSNSEDLCLMGTSRIVGGHVREVDTKALPKPKLLTTTAPYQNVLWQSPSQAQNSLLLGLSIHRAPMCVVGSADATYANRYQQTGAAGGGQYTLHSMIAGQDASNASTETQIGGAGGLRQLVQNLQMQTTLRTVGWASSVE